MLFSGKNSSCLKKWLISHKADMIPFLYKTEIRKENIAKSKQLEFFRNCFCMFSIFKEKIKKNNTIFLQHEKKFVVNIRKASYSFNAEDELFLYPEEFFFLKNEIF